MANTPSSMVHIRVNEQTKIQATRILAAMGLSVSDVVRMLLIRIAAEKALPFEVRVPNTKTVEAIRELENGKGKSFTSIDALMDDLNADD